MADNAKNRLVLSHIRKGDPIAHFPVQSWNTLVDGLQNMRVVGGNWDMTEGKDGFILTVNSSENALNYAPFQVLGTEWSSGGCTFTFWFDPDCIKVCGQTVDLTGLGFVRGENTYTATASGTVYLTVKVSGDTSSKTLYGAMSSGAVEVSLSTSQTSGITPEQGFCIPIWRIYTDAQMVAHVFRTVAFDMVATDGSEYDGAHSFANPKTLEREPGTNVLSVAGVTNGAAAVKFLVEETTDGVHYILDEENCPCDAFFMRRAETGYSDGTEAAFVPVKLEFDPIPRNFLGCYAPFQVLSVDWAGNEYGFDITFWFDPSCVFIAGKEVDLSQLGYSAGINTYHAFPDETTVYLEVLVSQSGTESKSLYTELYGTSSPGLYVYLGPTQTEGVTAEQGFSVPVWRINRSGHRVANVFRTICYDGMAIDGNENEGRANETFTRTLYRDPTTNILSVAGVTDPEHTVRFRVTQNVTGNQIIEMGYYLDEETCPGNAFFMRRKADYYVDGYEALFVPVKIEFDPMEIPDPNYIPKEEDIPDVPDVPEYPGDYIISITPDPDRPEQNIATWKKFDGANFWKTDGTIADGNTAASGTIYSLTSDYLEIIGGISLSGDGKYQITWEGVDLPSGSFEVVHTSKLSTSSGELTPIEITINGQNYTVMGMAKTT